MTEEYKRENRIAEALSIRGWKQIDLAAHTGINKSSINGWIKQNWQPKQKSLMKMAQALDVSEMWLAGYDVPMERPAAQKNKDELRKLIFEINENENLQNLFIEIRHLSFDQQKTIESMVNELIKANTLH